MVELISRQLPPLTHPPAVHHEAHRHRYGMGGAGNWLLHESQYHQVGVNGRCHLHSGQYYGMGIAGSWLLHVRQYYGAGVNSSLLLQQAQNFV